MKEDIIDLIEECVVSRDFKKYLEALEKGVEHADKFIDKKARMRMKNK